MRAVRSLSRSAHTAEPLFLSLSLSLSHLILYTYTLYNEKERREAPPGLNFRRARSFSFERAGGPACLPRGSFVRSLDTISLSLARSLVRWQHSCARARSALSILGSPWNVYITVYMRAPERPTAAKFRPEQARVGISICTCILYIYTCRNVYTLYKAGDARLRSGRLYYLLAERALSRVGEGRGGISVAARWAWWWWWWWGRGVSWWVYDFCWNLECVWVDWKFLRFESVENVFFREILKTFVLMVERNAIKLVNGLFKIFIFQNITWHMVGKYEYKFCYFECGIGCVFK